MSENMNLAEVGARIRAIRSYRGRTLDDVAGELSLAPSTVSRIENGRGGVTVEQLGVIARALDVSVETLTGGLGVKESGKCRMEFKE